MAVVVVLVLGVFGVRSVDLQAVRGDQLAAAAAASRLTTVDMPAQRGRILDADGVPLAVTVNARNVVVDPKFVTDAPAAAAKLAPALGIPADTLLPRLTADRRFVYLAKGVSPARWQAIEALRVPGVFSEPTTERVYPAGEVAANLVGFVGADGSGLGGLEYSLQKTLAGSAGSRTVEQAPGGREIPDGASAITPAVNGSDVRLTIDRDIQWMAQRELAERVAAAQADGGSIVVMDVRTGRILALAAVPTFDPNNVGDTPAKDIGNGAVADAFEPGSTAKLMTWATALDRGLVRLDDRLTIPSSLSIAGKSFHDSTVMPSNRMTPIGVMARSSNLGTIMAAEKVGPTVLADYLERFGFGRASGIGLPGENPGRVPQPGTSSWSGTTLPTVAFGQGFSVNAVQMASAYATIANGGVRVAPSVIDATIAPDGTVTPAPEPTRTRVVSARTAAQVTEMLEAVVHKGGTAPNAGVPGYRVAGKTGTALRPSPKGGYEGYVSSFVGFAPADAPRIVVSVTIDNPHRGRFGGQISAPVFSSVMTFALQQLRIPPTGSVTPDRPLTW